MATKKKKRPSSLARNKLGRFVKKKKAHAKKSKAKRRRNPEVIKLTKGKKTKFHRGLIQADINAAEGLVSRAERLAASAVTDAGKKSAKRKVSTFKNRLEKMKAKHERDMKRARKLLADGWKKEAAAEVSLTAADVARGRFGKMGRSLGPKKRTSKSKKKSTRKSKRAGSRRRSNPVARKKKKVSVITKKMKLATVAKAARPKKPRRFKLRGKKGKVARVSVSRSKFRKARNPFSVQSLLAGHSLYEAGGLLAGGALFSTVNKGVLKLAGMASPKLAEVIQKLPMSGSIVNIAIGALIHSLATKRGMTQVAAIGKGIVGSAVVGVGVALGQKISIPGLSGVDYTPMAGVDYTPMGDVDFGDADFGSLGDAQMGELPEGLSGVDFTPMGDVDFGELPEGLGELPEGLGEGQMG